ncbi:reelin domain-containing protein 1-like [Physella acuta]|uniref:reelin domain-containing protein 1-like n=1 Tax=Physella acuta TaxID=109671 RepID=UPI0027DE2B0A|nr:reelin domain-containing protein 1-like [Physella acuta]
MDLPVFVVSLCLVFRVSSFPTGGPLSACSHLMPVHIDGELQEGAPPYVLILNDTTYGSHPLKLTVSAIGPSARDFMAFMLQARSEFGQTAGHFAEVPMASKTMTCYGDDDTLTHTAAFIRPSMEVTWYPPPKNIGKISITGSIAVSKAKFWAVESAAIHGTGKMDLSGAPSRPGGGNGSPGLAGHVTGWTLLAVVLATKFFKLF